MYYALDILFLLTVFFTACFSPRAFRVGLSLVSRILTFYFVCRLFHRTRGTRVSDFFLCESSSWFHVGVTDIEFIAFVLCDFSVAELGVIRAPSIRYLLVSTQLQTRPLTLSLVSWKFPHPPPGTRESERTCATWWPVTSSRPKAWVTSPFGDAAWRWNGTASRHPRRWTSSARAATPEPCSSAPLSGAVAPRSWLAIFSCTAPRRPPWRSWRSRRDIVDRASAEH